MPEPTSQDTRTPEPVTTEARDTGTAAADELPDLADAFRSAHAERQAAESPAPKPDDDEADDDDDGEDSSGEAPETEATPDDAPPSARLSRTQRLRQQIEQVTAERDQHRQALAAYQQTMAQRQHEVLQAIGSEQEWSALMSKRIDPSQTLTYEEEDRYQQLYDARTKAAAQLDMAWNSTNARLLTKAAELGVQKVDLPRPEDGYTSVDPTVLVEKIVAAAEARVRQETSDEIERLKADRDSLLTKRAGRSPDPGVGGRSSSSVRTDMPDWDTADPQDFFLAGARQRAAQSGRRT